MKVIVLESTGMPARDVADYVFCQVCDASGFSERESLNRLSAKYFASRLLGLAVFLYYVDETDESCTSYYIDFEWRASEVVDDKIREGTVDLFLSRLTAKGIRWRF